MRKLYLVFFCYYWLNYGFFVDTINKMGFEWRCVLPSKYYNEYFTLDILYIFTYYVYFTYFCIFKWFINA